MNPLDLAGELGLRLAWDAGCIRSAEVIQTRPLAAARLLRGKTPAAAQALMPALFALCAQGQGAAASLALAHAAGLAPSEEEIARWRARIAAEAFAETAWRLLIDWPAMLGLEARPAAVARARALAQAAIGAGAFDDASRAALSELAAEQVLGEAPTAFLARRDAQAFDQWLARASTPPATALRTLTERAPHLGTPAFAPLPELSAELLTELAAESDPGFAAHPHWRGATAETGALARLAEQPMIEALIKRDGALASTRFAARLVEFAQLAADPVAATSGWLMAQRLPDGRGVAGVQTARGLLVHVARIEAGTIADYQIVAPTEWNFAAEGPLATGLTNQPAADAAAAQTLARVWVQALDPCVGCHIEVIHA